MAGERGTESTISDTERRVESAGRQFVIVGPPGSGKAALSASLRKSIGNLAHRSQPWLYVAPVGAQADYRTELLIASNRASALHLDRSWDYVSTHSLVDSLAYSVLNTRRLAENDAVSDEIVDAHGWATGAIMYMYKHSFRYDEVFLIDVEEDDPEIPQLGELYRAILDESAVPYTILDGDPGQWATQAATIISECQRPS